MTIFDLLFIFVFLASVATLLTAGVALIRGPRSKALRILKVYGICLAIYLGVVAAVALVTPRRIVRLGEARCFDDWCIAVQHAEHEGTACHVTFQVSSRARRVTQREKGVHAYLTDAQNRRFDPLPDPKAIPFDVLLNPVDSVETERSFTLPNDARGVGVVVAHEGPFCFPGCFIIGEDGNPLRRPAIVPLP